MEKSELRKAIEKEFYFMTHGVVGMATEAFIDKVERLVKETADEEWNTHDIFLCICYALSDLIEKEG